jgi:hypothetical protein
MRGRISSGLLQSVILFDGSDLHVRASDGGAMNRGVRAGARVRNTQVPSSVIMPASTSKCLALPPPTCQPTRRRCVVARNDGRGVSEWAPGSDCSDGELIGRQSGGGFSFCLGVTLCSRNG